jgi:ketosteroid isomerase-like protein
MKKISKNIKTVLDILEDEVRGDVKSALKKMTADYSMTWVDAGIDGKQLFPSTGKNIRKEMEEVYHIKGRKYDIKNIAEGKDMVMVELVESYPNPKTKKVYRTPLVLVLEMKNGKIKTGRHYLDPRLSGKHLTKKQIAKIFK